MSRLAFVFQPTTAPPAPTLCSFPMRERHFQAVCFRDKLLSKTPVVVEYSPQLVTGSAIFLAFKLGVTDIYSKALPTIALQKTSSQKTTVEGASFARFAPRAVLSAAVCCLPVYNLRIIRMYFVQI